MLLLYSQKVLGSAPLLPVCGFEYSLCVLLQWTLSYIIDVAKTQSNAETPYYDHYYYHHPQANLSKQNIYFLIIELQIVCSTVTVPSHQKTCPVFP